MPVLVDGNNVLHRLPPGERSREGLRRRMLQLARGQRMRLEVVFDGAPPEGTPAVELLGPVTIRYSGHGTADDLIIHRLPSGPSARNWTIVTDDRELARRAAAAGARTLPVSTWLARLEDPSQPAGEKPEELSPGELEEWIRLFSRR